MLNVRKVVATTAFLLIANGANAALIDFDLNNDQDYFVDSVTSNGFVVVPATVADNNIGTSDDFDTNGQGNGTVYLSSWSNTDPATGLTLAVEDGSLFSLESFDFNNAYPDLSNATSSILVSGLFADNTSVSQIFSNLEAILTFETLFLNDSFQNLVSVEFTARGAQEVRALYDNINVNSDTVDVSSPAIFALFGLSIAGLGFASRNKK